MKQVQLQTKFPQTINGGKLYLELSNTSPEYIKKRLKMMNRHKADFKYLLGADFEDLGQAEFDDSLTIKEARQIMKEELEAHIEEWNEGAENRDKAEYNIFNKNGRYIGNLWAEVYRDDKTVELMYFIDEKYRGRGIASLAFKMLEKKLIKMQFEKAILRIKDDNINSISIAEKNDYLLDKASVSSNFTHIYQKVLTK